MTNIKMELLHIYKMGEWERGLMRFGLRVTIYNAEDSRADNRTEYDLSDICHILSSIDEDRHANEINSILRPQTYLTICIESVGPDNISFILLDTDKIRLTNTGKLLVNILSTNNEITGNLDEFVEYFPTTEVGIVDVNGDDYIHFRISRMFVDDEILSSLRINGKLKDKIPDYDKVFGASKLMKEFYGALIPTLDKKYRYPFTMYNQTYVDILFRFDVDENTTIQDLVKAMNSDKINHYIMGQDFFNKCEFDFEYRELSGRFGNIHIYNSEKIQNEPTLGQATHIDVEIENVDENEVQDNKNTEGVENIGVLVLDALKIVENVINNSNVSDSKKKKRIEHIKRVGNTCNIMCDYVPDVNKKVVLLAATFHDIAKFIDKERHAVLGASMFRAYAKDLNLSEEEIRKTELCIALHGKVDIPRQPEFLEAAILTDADRIDKLCLLRFMDKESVEEKVEEKLKENAEYIPYTIPGEMLYRTQKITLDDWLQSKKIN